MKWIITKHARERKEERFSDVKIEFKPKISNYKYRYLDKRHKWHLYDGRFGVEIIGEEVYGTFYVITIVNCSLEEYLDKSAYQEISRYSNSFKYNIKLK